MKRLAIFVSGSGTNCENIIRYFKDSTEVETVLVLSNRADAYALVRAERLGIPTEIVPKKEFMDEHVLLPLLARYEVTHIILAGFLLVVPPFLINQYDHRIINLHPALLPKYGGRGMYGHHVHEAVKAAGEKETGITIHYVNEECDGGDIIRQFRVDLTPEDTVEDVEAKIHVLEQSHFPQVIEETI